MHTTASSAAAVSPARAWVLAARPKTLPAAVAPVLVASALAFSQDAFAALPATVALLCALLIQIATNLANDYFDYVKGADTAERIGPVRVVQSGLLPPRTVRNAMLAVLAVTFVLGLYLVWVGGWPILLIGVLSLLCAVAYTAGPLPLAYVGLGDVFVFVFFGVVAVMGTYFVQTLQWSREAFIASLPIGAISTAILVVNNYRDIDTDRRSNKRTLAVRIGRRASQVEYGLLLALAYGVALWQVFARMSPWFLLPLATLPLAFALIHVLLRSTDGVELNHALGGTGRLLALYALLYSIALLAG
jgi:1,4-dihydroxy-2-naphthoate octaprenyltransferase